MIHVVAGILRDEQGRVLLAQRPPGKHLAGLWEFPGGKCEAGESPGAALRRELREELGIDVGGSEPLIAVPWYYPEKSILLDVYAVLDWRGDLHGREGQALRWTGVDEMATLPMPPADRPVVAALRLPVHYAITPEPGAGDDAFLRAFGRLLETGEKCVQLRCKSAPDMRRRALARAVCALARDAGAQVLINGDVALALELDCGVHLPALAMMSLAARPLPAARWVAASCHDERELEQAAVIDADFAVLGPVLPTASHPGQPTLGWERFAQLCAQAPFPVYALGGLKSSDIANAKAAGAQGIAGISAFWPQSG